MKEEMIDDSWEEIKNKIQKQWGIRQRMLDARKRLASIGVQLSQSDWDVTGEGTSGHKKHHAQGGYGKWASN